MRGEQLVQRRVDGIERRADRKRELASAFGARVAGLQRNFGKESRAGFGERLRGALDFERLALQGEVAAQALGDVALDHRIELAFARAWANAASDDSEADAAEDQVAQHAARSGADVSAWISTEPRGSCVTDGLLTAAAPANTDQTRIEARNRDSTAFEKRSLKVVMVILLTGVTDVETLELDLQIRQVSKIV